MSVSAQTRGVSQASIEIALQGRIADLEAKVTRLRAENAALREYFESDQAIQEIGLFFASDQMLKRRTKARQAIAAAQEGK